MGRCDPYQLSACLGGCGHERNKEPQFSNTPVRCYHLYQRAARPSRFGQNGIQLGMARRHSMASGGMSFPAPYQLVVI